MVIFSTYRVIEGCCVDNHEIGQVVFVRCHVAVPSYHVESRVLLARLKPAALVFGDDAELDPVTILEPGARRKEVPWVGKTVGT